MLYPLLASGIDTAQAEVPNWKEYDLYSPEPGSYYVFDLPQFAKDYHFQEEFLKSKEEGGYTICQDIAKEVMEIDPVISGFIYSSYKMHEIGEQGYCLVMLPSDGNVSEKLFFKVKNHK